MKDTDEYLKLQQIPAFFERLALLERHGAVSLDLVRDMFGPTIVQEHDRWRPSIAFLQGYSADAFAKFEDLAARLR